MNIFLSIFVSLNLYAGGISKCQYPSADNFDSSPPSITGKVVWVDVNSKIIQVETFNSKKITIDMNQIAKTNLFTQFGGLITLAKIKPGYKTEIWLKDCSIPKKENNIAEVVKIEKD